MKKKKSLQTLCREQTESIFFALELHTKEIENKFYSEKIYYTEKFTFIYITSFITPHNSDDITVSLFLKYLNGIKFWGYLFLWVKKPTFYGHLLPWLS